MRILAWNLNHRAAARAVPAWVPAAIAAESPDVLVCTGYVRGEGHDRFLAALRAEGLRHSDVTAPLPGSPEVVVVAARESLLGGAVHPPSNAHPAVSSGFVHAILQDSGVHVLGFHAPEGGASPPPRGKACAWLPDALESLLGEPAILVADLAATLDGDPPSDDDACIERLLSRGWRLAGPRDEERDVAPRDGPRHVIRALVSPRLRVGRGERSWRFRALHADAAGVEAGVPDRAMLVVEVELPPTGPLGVAAVG